MYAVFQSGGKQYNIIIGQIIYIDRINVSVGNKVNFNQVLFIRDKDHIQIGDPFVKQGKVIGVIIEHSYEKKVKIIKFHRRKHYRKFQGHRQCITKVKIIDIYSM